MLIKRVIVQDIFGKHVLSTPLKDECTEDRIREEFAKGKLPILSITVDTVGVALITVAKALK